jgi:flavin-dependent dehydrogenase
MTSTNEDRCGVVIVGARCAGAATALLLARAGVQVTLLDRSRIGADTLSTHALMRSGVLQLHRWGLLDELRRVGVPPIRRTVFRFGPDETVVTIRPIPGAEALYAPRRTLLDRMLVEAAQAAGARVRFGVTALGVARDDTGRVCGVHTRADNGDEQVVRAALSIGADGLGSRFSRWVDAPVERVGAHAGAVIYAYVRGLDDHGYEWFFDDGVAGGVIPTNGDVACVFVGMPPDRFRRARTTGIRATFDAVLPDVAPDLAARVRAGEVLPRLRSYPGIPGYQLRPYGDGWALVGDAAYHRDPLSTRGISDALRDAELLARAIVDGFGNGRLAHALECYRTTRNRLSQHVFATTDAIASYEWDRTTIRPLVRSLAAAQADEVSFLSELDTASLTFAG